MDIDLNLLLSCTWLTFVIGVLLPGVWLLLGDRTHSKIINYFLQHLYVLGKLKDTKNDRMSIFTDIPKSYFRHFYIIGPLVNISLLLFYRDSIFLFVMLICHMLRRLYECIYTHKFGSKSKMTCIHYFVGIVHYPLAGLSIIVDNKSGGDNHVCTFHYCLSFLLFISASYIQHRVHVILGKSQRTTNEYYPIPVGYWPFEYFSCPNYIAEIFIYISFYLVSHGTLCFQTLTVWVIANQCTTSLLNHRWYCKHYGQMYPSKRCAVIPYFF